MQCNSTLERKISTSTGQAETYAAQSVIKEIVWERHLLEELSYPQGKATILQTDNDGVWKQSTKSINHSIAKHYRISQAYIRSLVKEHVIDVKRVDTKFNPADLFTKALNFPAFERHRAKVMGPQTAIMQ